MCILVPMATTACSPYHKEEQIVRELLQTWNGKGATWPQDAVFHNVVWSAMMPYVIRSAGLQCRDPPGRRVLPAHYIPLTLTIPLSTLVSYSTRGGIAVCGPSRSLLLCPFAPNACVTATGVLRMPVFAFKFDSKTVVNYIAARSCQNNTKAPRMHEAIAHYTMEELQILS